MFAFVITNTIQAGGVEDALQLLSGTWAVTNETADSVYSSGNTAIGQVSFFDSYMTVNSGGFAAAGIVAGSEDSFCNIPLDPIAFKFIGKGNRSVMYVSYMKVTRSGSEPFPGDAVITIIERTQNKMTLVGNGGCGETGARISHLVRMQ